MTRTNRQRFADLLLDESRQKYPNLPDHARAITVPSDASTNGLTKCVIKWIELNGYQAERINSTGRYIDTRKVVTNVVGQQALIGSGKWIKSSGKVGTADISSVIKGRSVKIEIKFGKDRQSQAQKDYQAAIERAGGVYLIVRDFDGFLEWWDSNIQ
jgi:hypothetical protein